jgi:integrase
MVEDLLVDLPPANQTRNQILYALRRILLEAESEGLILRNPLEHVEPMGKGGRVRDVFAIEELRRMFPASHEELLAVWKTLKYAALFITMATTGIREGEARALQWRHLLPGGWLL